MNEVIQNKLYILTRGLIKLESYLKLSSTKFEDFRISHSLKANEIYDD